MCRNLRKILANPIMTFPIKKIINTELFIDRKYELYMHKGWVKNGPLRERYRKLAGD